ncbi:MAG: hypothetical protein M0C28_03865 [Candidatus Moduliflexus flocculans]|nr:hypothetical protein [Candidatus Moduliflexus flocculans]
MAALRPAFNTLAGKQIPFAALFSPPFLAGLLAATAVTAVVAGQLPVAPPLFPAAGQRLPGRGQGRRPEPAAAAAAGHGPVRAVHRPPRRDGGRLPAGRLHAARRPSASTRNSWSTFPCGARRRPPIRP